MYLYFYISESEKSSFIFGDNVSSVIYSSKFSDNLGNFNNVDSTTESIFDNLMSYYLY